MQTSILRRSSVLAALTALLLAAMLVLLAPSAASAHDALIGSDPEAGSTVDTLPAELRLTYSAEIIAEGRTAVEVLDPDGASVVEGEPVINGAVVTQALGEGTVAGEYRVLWQVTSSDGHLTSDEFSFTLSTAAEPEPTEDPAAADAEATDDTDQTEQADDVAAADPVEDPATADTQGETTDDASEDTTFMQALPWIIIGVVLLGGGGALIAVLVNRAKRRGPEHSDGASAQ